MLIYRLGEFVFLFLKDMPICGFEHVVGFMPETLYLIGIRNPDGVYGRSFEMPKIVKSSRWNASFCAGLFKILVNRILTVRTNEF